MRTERLRDMMKLSGESQNVMYSAPDYTLQLLHVTSQN